MLPTHFIFNHIPKTAGITLLTICRSNVAPAEISPHLTEHEIRLMPAARFEHYRMVAGHFSILTQAGFCRDRYSMTLLRDPIRRIISAYTYWRMATEENIVTSKAKELSFAGFIHYFLDSPSIVDNPYTYHFAGIARDLSGYPTDTSLLLAAAKENLAAFNFVGICEEFEQSARLLCDEAGWRLPVPIPHENRSFSEDGLSGMDQKTLDILRERNRIDIELYEYGVALFHERVEKRARATEVETNRFVPFPPPYAPERRATIRSATATWAADENSRLLELTVRFQTRVPIAELSLGVQINDVAGRVVWGTSTLNENLALNYETGCECRGTFYVQCELPRGLYFLTVALSEPRRLGFQDHWIDRAALFEVTPSRVAAGPYVRGMKLQEFQSTVEHDSRRASQDSRQLQS